MEHNKQNPAKIVAMKMAECMNQPAKTGSKRKGCLAVIDQKPPVGDTTTMMLHFLIFSAVDDGRPSAYFSLGLSNIETVNRMIAIQTGIDHEKIVSGQLTDDEWKMIDQKLPMLTQAPLYIDDTPEMTLAELQRKLEGLAEKGVTLVVIDNEEKITADGQTDTDAAIKETAEQLGMTIIAITD